AEGEIDVEIRIGRGRLLGGECVRGGQAECSGPGSGTGNQQITATDGTGHAVTSQLTLTGLSIDQEAPAGNCRGFVLLVRPVLRINRGHERTISLPQSSMPRRSARRRPRG